MEETIKIVISEISWETEIDTERRRLFMDFKKAFVSVKREKLCQYLRDKE